jgi:hypothetical protein
MVPNSVRERSFGINRDYYHRRDYCRPSHPLHFRPDKGGPFSGHRAAFPPQMQEMRDRVRLCVVSWCIVHFGAPSQLALLQVSRLWGILGIQHLGYKS